LLTPVAAEELRLKSVRQFQELVGLHGLHKFVADLMELLRIAQGDAGHRGEIEPQHWVVVGRQLNELLAFHGTLAAEHACVEEAQAELEKAVNETSLAMTRLEAVQMSLSSMNAWRERILAWATEQQEQRRRDEYDEDSEQDKWLRGLIARLEDVPLTIRFEPLDADPASQLAGKPYAEAIVKLTADFNHLIRLVLPPAADGTELGGYQIVWEAAERQLTMDSQLTQS
jgi:hypothetical protein